MLGRNTPNWSTSLRLRSPPERSTLSGRERKLSSKPTLFASAARSAGILAESRPEAVNASPSAATKLTPGTSIGYCSARKSPARARCHAGIASRSAPSRLMRPRDDLVPRPARYDVRKGGLAGAVRAHHRMHLPAGYGQVHAAQYFLSPHRRMQALYEKFAHGMLTTTSSPSIVTG